MRAGHPGAPARKGYSWCGLRRRGGDPAGRLRGRMGIVSRASWPSSTAWIERAEMIRWIVDNAFGQCETVG